ncbi:helix-turn-helix domain-containing protein [Weissella koreensis]|uniref:helix-turn-helix domain-containing protein n=1 Tax=Weissella koreensis TaxID=165096 RepID=UPI000CF33AD7|nr:helix-turn-helix transcriptional regulator [Weissella koreensis]AVH74745.1 transcriptional regulator [Weissella koreensis]QGN19969.1 helix-turn-helix domain-containing protein [Weissella koreensis]
MTPLGRIKEIAKNKGLSLQKLAEQAGIGVNSIYRWSTKTPSTASLQKVANVLGVSVDYLLGNTNNMKPNKKGSSDLESNDVKEFFQKHEVFSYDGKPISEKDLATIKFILENGYEDK